MREYMVKVRNGNCRESELTIMFNELASQGWVFDKISSSGSDGPAFQRVYIVFYKEK